MLKLERLDVMITTTDRSEVLDALAFIMTLFWKYLALSSVISLVYFGSFARSADLAAHRAIYDLSLLSGGGGADFTDVNGKMYLDWSDVCDGWTLTQHVRMIFVDRNGNTITNDFSFSSWESRDGSKFRYTMRSTTNDELNEQIEGRAQLHPGRAGGVALFSKPEESSMELPAGTLFPTEHLFLTIDHAMSGGRNLTRNVFSGTGDDSLNEVSAFIGPVIAPASVRPEEFSESQSLAESGLEGLRSWPVAMAYFPYGSGDHQPEFEVHFQLMENGVSPSMDLDYGKFAIRGLIEHLEYHSPPDC